MRISPSDHTIIDKTRSFVFEAKLFARMLDENFGIANLPVEHWPQTLDAFSELVALNKDECRRRLRLVQELSRDVEISAEELAELRRGERHVILLDVRQEREFAQGHVPGSILLSTRHFPRLLEELKRAEVVVTICRHGVRSLSAAMYLRSEGVASARSLAGGFESWRHRP